MNRIYAAVIAVALAACGSSDDAPWTEADGPFEHLVEVRDGAPVYSEVNEGLQGDFDVDAAEPGDLGQSLQPLLFAPNAQLQPGYRPGDEQGCVKSGGSSQNCVVPPVNGLVKRFRYYIEGGWGPRVGGGAGTARFDVYSQLTALDVDLAAMGVTQTGPGRFELEEVFDLADPDLTFVVDVSDGGDFCSGATSKGLTCLTGSTTGIAASGLVGTYHRMVNVPVIHIDYRDIRTRPGWTTTQRLRVLRQAIQLALWKGVGIGPTNNTFATRCDQNSVLTTFSCTIPEYAACWINGWGDFGAPDLVWTLGADCGG